MNSCLWILLLLGCCGNSGNSGCGSNSCGCNQNNYCGCCNNCNDNCNSNCGCDDNCGCNNNLIQPRVNNSYRYQNQRNNNWYHDNDCGCQNKNNWDDDCDGKRFTQNSNFMTPPPVPGRVRNDDERDCGCND